MGRFLVDTSVLRVFSSVDRLDLLAPWSPIFVTQTILREHGQAPQHAQAAVTRAIQAGQIAVIEPGDRGQIQLLDGLLGLGYSDCEGILVAERDGLDGIFIADKGYREACARRGIPTTAVGAVLLHLKAGRKLSPLEVQRLATAMESSRYYLFPAHERARLGLT